MGLFITYEDRTQLRGANSREGGQRTHARNQTDHARRLGFAKASRYQAEERSCQHAPADCFSVHKSAVTRGRLQRMPQSVPEIQDVTQAAFAFIFRHHVRFDANAARYHPGKRSGVAPQ